MLKQQQQLRRPPELRKPPVSRLQKTSRTGEVLFGFAGKSRARELSIDYIMPDDEAVFNQRRKRQIGQLNQQKTPLLQGALVCRAEVIREPSSRWLSLYRNSVSLSLSKKAVDATGNDPARPGSRAGSAHHVPRPPASASLTDQVFIQRRKQKSLNSINFNILIESPQICCKHNQSVAFATNCHWAKLVTTNET